MGVTKFERGDTVVSFGSVGQGAEGGAKVNGRYVATGVQVPGGCLGDPVGPQEWLF